MAKTNLNYHVDVSDPTNGEELFGCWSYQLLSFNYGWKIDDEDQIKYGLFPQVEAQKHLSMKVSGRYADAIDELRDAHREKRPLRMVVSLFNFAVKPPYVSADLTLDGVRVQDVYPITEGSDAFRGTQWADIKATLFGLEVQTAKTLVIVKPSYQWKTVR